jgi:hypothetical protein
MKNLPNFKPLADRLMNKPSDEPMLVIQTNLDPKHVTEENPYAQGKKNVSKTFEAFFKGEET